MKILRGNSATIVKENGEHWMVALTTRINRNLHDQGQRQRVDCRQFYMYIPSLLFEMFE